MASEVMSAYVRFFVKDDVSKDIQKVEKSAEKAADGMDEAADAAGNDLKKAFDDAKGSAANFAKGLAAVGAAGVAIVGAMFGLADSTAETARDLGKLEAAFTSTGQSAETARGVYDGFVGLLGDSGQATEAAVFLAELTNNEKELAAWTNISAGVYAKFGNALPLEGLTEAANETAKTGALTGGLADALNWAGVNEAEFQKQLDACNTEQERSALITSTLNGLYGETGQAYQENNAGLIAQQQAQSNFNLAMAELGNTLRPLVADILNFGAAFVSSVKPYLEWFIANLPTIAPIVAGIVTAFTAYKTITTAVTVAQKAMNLVMMANPFVLIISLVLGLVAAFVTAWTTSETFREKVKAIFAAIKNAISSAIEKVKSIISGMVSAVSNSFNSIKSKATSIFNAIKSAITKPIETAKNIVKGVVDKIKGFFNFKVSLPKIKLPHFSIKPKGWELGDLLKGSIPSLGIEWYAKGGIFDKPTIFPTASGLKGVGEAGAEAVAPLSDLMGYVRAAVRAEMGAAGGYVANITVNTGETDETKLARMIAREEKRQAYALGAL